MKWKLKARVQNIIDLLPSDLSYSTYYWIQRNFGGLRNINPISGLKVGVEVCMRLEKCSRSAIDNTFLEVGTGRRINVPIAFWLAGAKKIITVDLNPYLKEELVREDIDYMKENRNQIVELFGGRIYENRFNKLIELTDENWRLVDLLKLCNINYIAPGNATNLTIPSESVDFHISHNVFEHIPQNVLKAILKEGNRVTKRDGIFLHRVDYRDHFSYSDKSISAINFLQYTDDEWAKFSGNRYMYTNRLRADDFIELFKSLNHRIVINEPEIDPSVNNLLR